MQNDPAARSRQPCLHHSGMMVARIVEIGMDAGQCRIEIADGFYSLIVDAASIAKASTVAVCPVFRLGAP